MPTILGTLRLFAAPFVLCSCASPSTELPIFSFNGTFDADGAAYLIADGPNTISGNAFLRQQGGAVVTCAGSTVTLIPATMYAQARIKALYGNTHSGSRSLFAGFRFIPDPAEYHNLTRTTKCDSGGNFRFERVANGDFFATVSVSWLTGSGTQGSSLMHRVMTDGGQVRSVIMSR